MNLEQLTAGMPELVKITGNAQTEIKALTADSRAKCEDGLFFCIRGGRVDAHDFAPQAVAGGCVALVVERELAIDCPQVVVTDVRAAMTRIASAFNGHPERRMKLVGVTGTKGKTTTTYLFKSIVESAGMRCGIIGTTGCIAGQTKLPSHLTTPDPIEMFEILRIMADAGVEVVCMEVSAHALYLRKLVGVVFEAAAYTNLSQDHLDFFGTMDNYLAAKKLLFSAGMARNAAVNVDEETAKAVCDSLDCPLLTYGISGKADLFARDIEITETGVSFTLNLRNLHAERVHLLLTGMFNVYNALAAAALRPDSGRGAGRDQARSGGRGQRARARGDAADEDPVPHDSGLQPFAGRAGEHSENRPRVLPRAHHSGVRLRRRPRQGQAPDDGRNRGQAGRLRDFDQRQPAL